MSAITLPLTFTNSFWTEDYRRGLETIYTKLEQGIAENDEVIAFIKARAVAERNLADSLTYPGPTGPRGTGFDADEGASLLVAFRGLQAESVSQGEVHRNIAKELEALVVDPFEDWARGHNNRVESSRNTVIDGFLKAYEHAQGEVDKLKHQYLDKTRRADEAEDDAKFAPANDLGDNYTSSPRLTPRDHRNPQRTASVSERIAQRFKELQRKASPTAEKEATFDEEPSTSQGGDGDATDASKVDKGKGRAVDEVSTSPQVVASPPPMSPALPPAKIDVKPPSPMPPHPPPPILLAGLALPPQAVSDLLKRAAAELSLRPVKFPLIGEYKDCFTGEEFATWLVDNVQGLGGSLDRAEDAARDLCERDGILRRVGEFGNAFENNEESFYQFRPKAFNLHEEYVNQQAAEGHHITSPVIANLTPMADNLVKRSGTFLTSVKHAIGSTSSEPKYIRLRSEADVADNTYRLAVRRLDRQRLGLEERIEETLKALQKWELDRLRAVKTVLLQFQGTLANLPTGLQPSLDRSSTLIVSYQAESDLKALIEQYRTGPFKPVAKVYDSISHDEYDVHFGIDLRRWADGGWAGVKPGDERDNIPDVLSALLAALNQAYAKLPNDTEKRKSWIYEVPLPAVHHLRETLNGIPPGLPIPPEILEKYDAPVIASTVKLWALELNPPLGLWEGWDDIRRIYPAVGASAKSEESDNEQQRTHDLQVALLRLPKIHLYVIEALFGHLKHLIETTTVEEPDDIYESKLALSMGRVILRPQHENEKSIQDRHPTLLFLDLLKHFKEIIPTTIAKKRESDRRVPIRKRTAPIDMRISRSRLSVGADTREILEAQLAAKNPTMKRAASPAPPVPAAPAGTAIPPPPPLAQNIPPPPPLNIPPPPPLQQNIPPPPTLRPNVVPPATPPPPPIAPTPMRAVAPTFVDPTVPSRPKFREPPPEPEDATPPMPRFVSPPPETDDSNSPTPAVLPPTSKQEGVSSPSPVPTRGISPISLGGSDPASPIDSGGSLSRSSSGPRGPRIAGARGPRPLSQNVASITANLNRVSQGGARSASPSSVGGMGNLQRVKRSSFGNRAVSPVNPHDYEPRKRGGRAQAGAFSRRTMASDAEDEVVAK